MLKGVAFSPKEREQEAQKVSFLQLMKVMKARYVMIRLFPKKSSSTIWGTTEVNVYHIRWSRADSQGIGLDMFGLSKG